MKFKKPKAKKRPHFINEEIRAPKVRLISEDKKQIGIVSIAEALAIAKERELDLVAISPKTEPPVCRLLDYGKYLYSLQKKAHEAQKMQRKVHIKEIKFTPVIGEHDIDVKLKKIKEFLDEGDKVKVTIWLRGRQKRRPELLDEMTSKIMKILEDFAEFETPPKTEKWSTHLIVGKRKPDKGDKVEGDKPRIPTEIKKVKSEEEGDRSTIGEEEDEPEEEFDQFDQIDLDDNLENGDKGDKDADT